MAFRLLYIKITDEFYTPAIALEGWSYIRYVGPFPEPELEHVFLCATKEDCLIVARKREGSKLWYINRLRADEDNLHRNACALKREGSQLFLSCYVPAEDAAMGELFLSQRKTRFDMLRVERLKRPCYIRVYQERAAPEEEVCQTDDTVTSGISDDSEMDMTVTEGTDLEGVNEGGKGKRREEEEQLRVEWFLGISHDFRAILKPFPPESECTPEQTRRKPVWEFITRDEAMDEDNPPKYAPVWDPRRANDPTRREFFTRPDRFRIHDRGFWPKQPEPRTRGT
ncbi:hypothetical protein AMATHDRAFT_64936 [Amanita thiersii Skay4041]|uniref:Uncharacterized protein n=1 Tax=Amanita thiersii Skay4041 TaxID=703135 RepID=A0A2A9NF04_9AGAR|nr:hypothetical protein AMATHDRAFT_64936 [Amanita thiersii Skay4041]